jgi:hypothetical protein
MTPRLGDIVHIGPSIVGEVVSVEGVAQGQMLYRVRIVGTERVSLFFESELKVLGENLKGEVKKGAKREDR